MPSSAGVGSGPSTSLVWLLARVLLLLVIVPFLPLAWLTFTGHRDEVARVEGEIQASNRHIAALASEYLTGLVASLRREALDQRKPDHENRRLKNAVTID